MKRREKEILTAAVVPELKDRVEDAVEKIPHDLRCSKSELIEAILSAFFKTNEPPTDSEYAEILVRRLRKGDLKLCVGDEEK